MLQMIKIITSYGEFYGDPSFVTELTDMIFEILPTGFSFLSSQNRNTKPSVLQSETLLVFSQRQKTLNKTEIRFYCFHS